MKLSLSVRRAVCAPLRNKADAAKILLAAVFIVLVFLPLVRMFSSIDLKTLKGVITAPGFAASLRNSLTAAGLSTVLSVSLAYLLALCMERTTMRLKGLLSVIFVLPMLLPSVSHGMGLIILLGILFLGFVYFLFGDLAIFNDADAFGEKLYNMMVGEEKSQTVSTVMAALPCISLAAFGISYVYSCKAYAKGVNHYDG